MTTKQNLFFVSNKKAFTLIEVLISITILVLIFTFLYSQFNLAQISTKKTTTIEKSSTKRAKIIELLYSDLMTAQKVVPTSRKNYDRFIEAFPTQNSLYGIENPYIKYVVVADDETNTLLRIEGKRKDIGLQNANSEFYADKIVEKITYFKVIVSGEYIELFLQAEDMKDIYFKFKKVVK